MKIVEDDFWGDGGDDDPASGNATAELDREWHARREEFWNSGYREGIEAGKHDTVQEGFDSGYAQGAASGYEWGVLRGAALALQAAAAKGLVPTAAAEAAAQPIAALAPGEVQGVVGRGLMKEEGDGTGCAAGGAGDGEKAATTGCSCAAGQSAEDERVASTRRQAEEAIEGAGFSIQCSRPK